VTHEYTILLGGRVHATPSMPGAGGPARASWQAPRPTAIAWADDTVLAVGSDAAVRSISRGDSRFIDLHGAHVVPLAETLEPGAPADFEIRAAGPASGTLRVVAVVRAGQVVDGALPQAGERPRPGSWQGERQRR
jgi:hypothetical protein